MKITKKQLKKIIKEALTDQMGGGEYDKLKQIKATLDKAFLNKSLGLRADIAATVLSDIEAILQGEKPPGEEIQILDPGAPESSSPGHPYDYPPGEEWKHKY